MTWATGTNAWWIILTVLVVLQPEPERTRSRGVARAGGTVLGGAVAAIAVVLVGSGDVLGALGLLAAIASAFCYLRAPYWAFAATLTMALVWLTMPDGRRLWGDVERVAFTVLAAAAVMAVTVAIEAATVRLREGAQP